MHALPFPVVGAAISRPDRTPRNHTGPAIIAALPWQQVDMPPYEVRRGCGANRGPVRADMKSAPTDAPATLLVVGAHCICARTAPPEAPGSRASRPGHGGMWACRPTRLGGGAAGIGGVFGRLIAAPTAFGGGALKIGGVFGRLIAAPTAFGGGALEIGGLHGRPYRPPLRRAITWSVWRGVAGIEGL